MESYYEILGVSTDASPVLIELGYRSAVRKLNANAKQLGGVGDQLSKIEQAYDVLRDPDKRRRYDQGQSIDLEDDDTDTEIEELLPFDICCTSCGRRDSSLRGVALPYTFSILIMSFRRGFGGVFCSRCLNVKAVLSNSITMLFGWWGIPWGPIWSISCLWTNVLGGKQERAFNSNLLAALSVQLSNEGRWEEAYCSITESLRLLPTQESQKLANRIHGNLPKLSTDSAIQEDKHRNVRHALIRAIPLLILMAIMVFNFFKDDPSKQTPTSSESVANINQGKGVSRSPGLTYSLQAQRLEEARARLKAEEDDLLADAGRFRQLGEKLESWSRRPKPWTRKQVNQYNNEVDRYNRLLTKGKTDQRNYEKHLDSFNEQVREYNRLIGQ